MRMRSCVRSHSPFSSAQVACSLQCLHAVPAEVMMVQLSVVFVLSFCLGSAVADVPPSVTLHNAARPNTLMPVMGIGTASYVHGKVPSTPRAEVWNDSVAEVAVKKFLQLGGRRIDGAHDYWCQAGVGRAIKASGVPRKEVFVTSKIDREALGYNSTLKQIDDILQTLQLDYVDLLLLHWPGPPSTFSDDPACQGNPDTWRECRRSSWKAMEAIYNANKTRAIGVSNFEQNHLEDIISMGGLIPSVNQIEYSIYWHEDDLVKACQSSKIVVNGYAPLGAPDWAPDQYHWNHTQLQDSLVMKLASKYKRTPAQIILHWEWHNGVVLNPRTMNEDHMKDNMGIFSFTLTQDEIKALANPPSKPKTNYKVCPDPNNIV